MNRNYRDEYLTYDITTGMDEGCTAQTTTDPKNNITLKIYDRVGRLWQVTADNRTTVYTYNNNGSVRSVVYSDGSREDYTYTGDNLLSTLTNTKADGTVIDSYTYSYDAADNMVSKTDARGTTTYAYDRFNRLVSVTESSGKTTTYTFDAAGNRKTQTVVLGTDTTITTYTYDSQNRLIGTQEQKNGVTTETVIYTYDNNGNQLSKTSTAYIAGVAQTPVIEQTNTYDDFNQLISTVTSTGVTVINTYNGDGRRVGKSVNGTSNDSSTRYLYEYDRVVLEVSVSGIQTGRNVYGINLLTRQVGGDTLIYMYNGHADVTALLSITGFIAATYYYDAFGNILEQTGVLSNNILYAGYQYDTETGLYYLNARMYDPVTARFMQEDTYTGEYNDPLSLNLYTYCKNEPIRYSDPTGHWAWLDNVVKKGASVVTAATKAVTKAVTSTVKAVANSTYGKAAIKTASVVAKTVTSACKSVASNVASAAHTVSKFVYDNRVAIAIGAVAVASVAIGVVTFGAGGVAMAALGGALIGGGVGLGLKEASDLSDNGKIDGTLGSYAGAYAIGAVAGASMAAGGAIGAQTIGGLALNGVSAASKLVGGTLVGGGVATGINAAMDIGNNGKFDSTAGDYATSYLEGAALTAAAEAVPSLFSAAKGVASKIGQIGQAGATSTPKTPEMNLQLFANKGGSSTSSIQPYEVTTYENFRANSVVGDGLEGHEVWQHANINENGFATTRLSTAVSKNNPVIALPHDVHVQLNQIQGSFNARIQSPIENVMANIDIMYENSSIPTNNIDDIFAKAQQYVKDVTNK